MKLNNREFLKISLIYTAVAAIPPLLQIIVRPLIEGTDQLNALEFSRLEIVESITSLVFIISMYSMGNAISRFYYDYIGDEKKYRRLVSNTFTSILIRGLALLAIAFLFRNQIGKFFSDSGLQDFSSWGFAAVINGINRSVNMTAFALYRNEKKIRKYIYFNLAFGVLRTLFQVTGVYYIKMDFTGYVTGTCIGSSFTTIAILAYTYYKSGFTIEKNIFRAIHSFARPLFQYALLAWGLGFADRYFLLRSPSDLGIYGQAAGLALGLQMILQGLQAATQPEIFRFMKEGIQANVDEIKKISNILMALSQVIIALAIIPAMLFFTYLYETELKLAAGLVAIIFIKFIQSTQYIIFSFPIYYEKKTKVFLYINTVALAINLALLYFLVPLIGIYGAIAAVLVSQSIQVAGTYIYQKRIVSINWNQNKLLIFPYLVIVITVILEIIKHMAGINTYITSSLVVGFIFLNLVILYRNEIRSIFAKRWKQSF